MFKQFCSAKAGTDEKKKAEVVLKEAKERLKDFLRKEKSVKIRSAINKKKSFQATKGITPKSE